MSKIKHNNFFRASLLASRLNSNVLKGYYVIGESEDFDSEAVLKGMLDSYFFGGSIHPVYIHWLKGGECDVYEVFCGQKVVTAITKFFNNEIKYMGKLFRDFDELEQRNFLNDIEIPVYDLNLDVKGEDKARLIEAIKNADRNHSI